MSQLIQSCVCFGLFLTLGAYLLGRDGLFSLFCHSAVFHRYQILEQCGTTFHIKITL